MKSLLFLLVTLNVAVLAVADGKPVVFVDKFVTNGDCRMTVDDVQILQDRIVGNVTSSRKYEVVERDNLAKVQQELKLVDAGLTEGEAPESNRLKAAGYCVYGKVIQYRSTAQVASVGDLMVLNVTGTIEIQIRLTNIQNGRILAAKTIREELPRQMSNVVKTNKNLEQEVMIELLDRVAKEVVVKLNDIAFPVDVLSANARFVTANVTEEQVDIGEVWEVYVLGNELKDKKTGESLGYDEDLIAEVRVSRPGAKTTKFEYGRDDASAEKAKKEILAAKEDGESMILRRAVKASAMKNQSRPITPKPSLREMF